MLVRILPRIARFIMDKKISIATGALQRKFGDMRAIEIAKEIGADAIDFETAEFSIKVLRHMLTERCGK